MPQIFTGLQIAMPICLIVVLVCEMVLGGQGIGATMIAHARYARTPGVFAGIIEIAVCGYAIIKGMEIMRRGLLGWHQEASKDIAA